MSNPKIYLTTLFTSLLVLILQLYFQSPNRSDTQVGFVVSQTVTQSLDGHRRYLSVRTQTNELILIQSPVNANCPKGYRVTFKEEQGLTQEIISYKFVSCSNN
ncbi:hypothetical protein [Vibrio nereis]|uniref:hypothetical protein n=1 Tax=Vibrio nereis TaxID=693 RepID=UPI002493DF80|nr:hypothetical protein [Vibrio nereis]